MTGTLVLLAVVAVVVFWLMGIYNGLVRLRNASRTPGARSTCSSSDATTSSPTWSRPSRATPARARDARGRRQGPPAGDQRLGQRRRAGQGREHAVADAAVAVRGRRGLPRPQGEPELPRPAGRARLDREQDLVRPPALQRLGDDLQQQDRDVPVEHRRRHVQLRGGGVLRDRGRGEREARRSASAEGSGPTAGTEAGRFKSQERPLQEPGKRVLARVEAAGLRAGRGPSGHS